MGPIFSVFWNDMFGVVDLHVFTILDFALIWFTLIFQLFSKGELWHPKTFHNFIARNDTFTITLVHNVPFYIGTMSINYYAASPSFFKHSQW